MTKKKIPQEVVWINRMAESLLGQNNDIIRLAWMTGEEPPDLEGLDFSLISEFKRNANGTVEVKLVDRVKALTELIALLRQWEAPSGDGQQATALYQALERQAGGRL